MTKKELITALEGFDDSAEIYIADFRAMVDGGTSVSELVSVCVNGNAIQLNTAVSEPIEEQS
jgi:hypothetical protein